MATLAISAILVGTAVGMRFKVLILLPATIIGLAAIIAGGVARGVGLPSIVLDAILAITGLQVGYLVGITIRYLIEMRPRRRAHGLT
jgi:hypothetical protein